MFKDFELAAIITKDSQKELQKELRYIPLSQDLQDTIKEELEFQYNSFFNKVERVINFDPGYELSKHELFCLHEHELPYWLANENSASISDFDPIQNNERQMSLIKGIAAFIQNETGEEFILFQRFMPAQVIRPKLSFIWDLSTFRKINNLGFMLGKYLSAVYQSGERKLLFNNFYNANLLLSLPKYFKEASSEKIREILSHELFKPEDIEISSVNSNQWFRIRFALLERSGILNRFTALEFQACSEECNVHIQLSDDKKKIVFPSNKTEAMELLQFLNQERFRGPITNELFETNSKKKVAP